MNTKRRILFLLSALLLVNSVLFTRLAGEFGRDLWAFIAVVSLGLAAGLLSWAVSPPVSMPTQYPCTNAADLDITFTTNATDAVAKIEEIIAELQDLSDRLRP
jgi:hypothetical protein